MVWMIHIQYQKAKCIRQCRRSSISHSCKSLEAHRISMQRHQSTLALPNNLWPKSSTPNSLIVSKRASKRAKAAASTTRKTMTLMNVCMMAPKEPIQKVKQQQRPLRTRDGRRRRRTCPRYPWGLSRRLQNSLMQLVISCLRRSGNRCCHTKKGKLPKQWLLKKNSNSKTTTMALTGKKLLICQFSSSSWIKVSWCKTSRNHKTA